MTALIFLVAIVGLIVVLFMTGNLHFRGADEASNTSVLLRELLIAKAEGRIDAEEFESRQAALHAKVLGESQGTSQKTSWGIPVYVRWGVPLFVIFASGFIYSYLGNPPGAESGSPSIPSVTFPASDKAAGAANTGGDLNAMGKRLAEKMAQDPKNGEGWLLLARTYGELKQAREAAQAYAKAAALLPPDATMLADWADTHVMANERKWDKEGREIIKRALSADGKHPKALALAGSEAFERGDYKGAIEFWKRMKTVAAPDSMDARLADSNIEEASAMLGGKRTVPVTALPAALPAATAGSLSGEVTLAPSLKTRFEASAVVFVIAKTVDGTGAPLAVLRRQVGDLPLSFVLDDSAAMLPERALSKFPEALISARVSPSGSATPQRGDIVSESIRVKAGAKDIKLELLFPR